MMPFLRMRASEKRMRRRPYVVIRREQKIVWGRGDSEAVRQFLLSDSGQKLVKICDDSIVAGVLPAKGEIVDPEMVGAITAGKAELLEFIFAHAGMKRNQVEGGEAVEEDEAAVDEKAVAAIQFQDD